MDFGGMDVKHVLDALKNSLFLGDVSPEGLASLAEQGRRRSLPEGQTLFRCGDPADELHLLLAGTVELSVSDAGERRVVDVIERGIVPGAFAFLDGEPCPVEATALTDIELLLIPRMEFLEQVRADPLLFQALLRYLVAGHRKVESEVRHLAMVDVLTGLYNRRQFMEVSLKETARARRFGSPLSVLLLDLDHFKQINDTYGHSAGDLSLKALGQTLFTFFRATDTVGRIDECEHQVIGRMAGEEFAVLLPGTGPDEAFEVAERLRKAVSGLVVDTDAGAFSFTCSVGVAGYQPFEPSIDAALVRAGEALDAAKSSGRNRVSSAGPVIPID